MEVCRIQNKLKMLFQKIVEPNYVMNNYYADGILNKLYNPSDPEIIDVFNLPLISDFIIEAFHHYDNLHCSVQVFVTRIVAAFSVQELHFIKLFSRHGDRILKGFQEINSPAVQPSLKVAFLEIAIRIVKHNSGINWLLETGVWKDILSLCGQKQTVFVVRQVYKFSAEFLWRLNDSCDSNNLKMALNVILGPLDGSYLTKETMTADEEVEITKLVEPVVHILTAVVSKENRIEKYSLLIDLLLREYKINSHLYVVVDMMRGEEFILASSKLMFWFVCAKLFLNKPMENGAQFNKTDLLDVNVMFFNFIQFFIQRRSANLVLDFSVSCNMIYWKIWKDKKKDIWVVDENNKEIIILSQILFMCLVPLLTFVRQRKVDVLDVKLQEFTERLLNSTCEHTAKGAYAFRSLVEEIDLLQVVVMSVKKLSSVKNHLNDEQANLIFQTLFYVLRDYDPIDDYGNTKKQVDVQQYENDDHRVQIMTYVMDTVLCLLKKHNINWCESFEVICLYTVVYNILQRPNLTTKFVVAALNVITMTVKLFLQPNLSLLLETKPGSPIDQLGKLIYRKLHDLSWEVRDSALELLLVCVEISFIKFPPFQKQILENDLVNVSAALAFNDYESYVQASALKCLGAASKVSVIWEQLKMKYPDIKDQILGILRNNQEGIVRKEACIVLCDIYQNRKLTSEFKHSLYEHMASTALSDFHWEVQINALKFWRMVFHSLLTDQGMLDGTFPPVTFSRETRKIVTLNEMEIQRRIMKILEELSSLGLFTILIKLLQDDSEVEVVETALCLSNCIIEVLNKYKVPETLRPRRGEEESADSLIFEIKEDEDYIMVEDILSEAPSSDNVIDGIVKADDLNLLATMYESHLTLQHTKIQEPIRPKLKLMKYASPYLFVKFLNSKDFKAALEEKRKWNEGIRSLYSLLEDVLGIYEVSDEINSLDCY